MAISDFEITVMHVGRLAVCAGYLVPSQLSEVRSVETFPLQLLSQFYHCFTFTAVRAKWRLSACVEYSRGLLICNTFNHRQTISTFKQPNSKNVVSYQFFCLPFVSVPFCLGKDFPEGEGWLCFCRQLRGRAASLLPFLPVRGLLHLTPSSSASSSSFFFVLLFPICYFILIVWCN